MIGTLILGEALAATAVLGTTLGSLVGNLVLVIGLIGLQYALAGSQRKPDDAKITLKQPISPRQRAYGRVRLRGTYLFYNEKAGTSYDVIAFHHGKIFAFVTFYFHDDPLLLSAAGVDGAMTVQAVPINSINDGRYVSECVISTRDGSASQTAFARLIAAFPHNWTSAHRGDHLAMAHIECHNPGMEDFFDKFPHGLPEVSVVTDCSLVFDPRDEAQSVDNPATWTFSRNPVLHLMDYLTHADGMGLDRDRLFPPDALERWMIEADICDEPVLLGNGGSAPRYRYDGAHFLDQEPKDIIGPILAACDGWFGENGDGTLMLVVGKYKVPTITIKENHVLALSVDNGVPDEQIVNEIIATYTSPDHDYNETPAQAWRDEDLIADLGRLRSQSIDLRGVQFHGQVRRLCKRVMYRINEPLRGNAKTTLYGLQLRGHRWAKLQYPTLAGLEDIVIEIGPNLEEDVLAGTVSFSWTRVNPNIIDAWDPVEEEGEAPPKPPRPVQGTIGATASPSDFTAEYDEMSELVNLGWTNPDSFTVALDLKVYRSAANDFDVAVLIETLEGAPEEVMQTTDNPASGTYWYYVTATLPDVGVPSLPAGPIEVTVPV